MAGINGGVIGVETEPTLTDKITTFNSTGTFNPGSGGYAPSTVDILVVAGGGGGGTGGGGAGGFRTFSSHPFTAGTPYPITVGAGGSGVTPAALPTNGTDSTVGFPSALTSAGGGWGGGAGINANSGGSGGGGRGSIYAPQRVGGAGNTPPTSPPQGNNGSDAYNREYGGAGGGASAVGTAAPPSIPVPSFPTTPGLAGGAGSPSTISGSDVTYAGGGGGGTVAPSIYAPGNYGPPGPGGAGGGGAGGAGPSVPSPVSHPTLGDGSNGTANLGGGGGGAGGVQGDPAESLTSAGNGGSGVVIIKEPNGNFSGSGMWDLNAVYTYRTENKWVGG